MKTIINGNTYPANILSSVFGTHVNEYVYYFDKSDFENTIERLKELLFTEEEKAAFDLLYKDKLINNGVAEKIGCPVERVCEMQSEILRELRRSCNSKLLKKYGSLFRVVPIDDNKSVVQLLEDIPIILTEAGEIRAVVLSADLYNRLTAKV